MVGSKGFKKKYKADVFLSPDNFLSLRTPIKTVLVTHDLAYLHFPFQNSFFQKKYYEIFSPRFNRRADHIVAVSEFTKKDIAERYGIDSDNISVACNGCSSLFQPLQELEKQKVRDNYAEGKPYFFYIGSIHPRKNVHRLIRAFSEFKKNEQSGLKLIIAGRFAWEPGEVKKSFDQSNCKSDIHFLGYVDDKELPKLMAGSLACTYVSLFEGFGIPILQAMHCEVPIITSNISSMPEVAGKAAILIDPFSIQEIANAMRQIFEDEHLSNRLIEEGRIQRKKFTWQKAADVVYGSILKVGAEQITTA